jgi:hypothetical protein
LFGVLMGFKEFYLTFESMRMYLGEVGLGGVYWIGLAEVRNNWRALVNAVMNLRVT